MNRMMLEWVSLTQKFIIYLLIILTPLLVVWNLTTDFFETPKFLILVIGLAILLLLWLTRFILEGKVSLTQTPLDLPFIVLLVVFTLSTVFAVSKPVAIMGNFPRISEGLAAIVSYTVLYFVIVAANKNVSLIKQTIFFLIGTSTILSILSLFSYAGLNVLYLPFSGAQNFTLTGSSFSTAAILILTIPFLLVPILKGESNEMIAEMAKESGYSATFVTKIIFTILLCLFATTIVLTGTLTIYIAALAVFILILLTTPSSEIDKNLAFLVTPVALVALPAILSFAPIAGSNNLLYKQAQNFPREIQLPFSDSWKISISAFRDSPFWGSGPSSYLGDFTTYKPIEFNNTQLWNIRFDQAFNEYLQFLATLGAPGLIALLLLTAVFLSNAFKVLSERDSLGSSLAISGISFFTLLALHPGSLPVWVVGVIILALFISSQEKMVKHLHFQYSAISGSEEGYGKKIDILPILIALPVLLLVGFFLYQVGNTALADYHHRQAMNAAAVNDGLKTFNELVAANQTNPYIDLYRINLANLNLQLANNIATSKGPTEASPGGSLTDTDKQNIQTLISQSINEGRNATVLNPNSPANWEVLGSIYRQIAGVAQNALTFALDSYGRAIQRDPLNPLLRLSVGGIYYSTRDYDSAIRFFTDAVNLKPDLANSYYNLSLALRDKGDLANAEAIAEKTVSLLDTKSPDYKVAADFLADLKSKVASLSAKQSTNQSNPAPQATGLQNEGNTSSALQGKNLPKVSLPNPPENIATPPAVKK